MKAVIMAGGEGSRLRPLTSQVPKPMMPLANRPLMEHVVRLLRRHGFDEIVVTVSYLADAIRTYFGDGSAFGVRMVYATEESPLGTAGSVRNARDELTERFLVISGDVLTDIDLTDIVAMHDKNNALATIGLTSVANPLEFGIVITSVDGSIERFLEKPSWGEVFSDTINTGIFVLEPEIFDHIPADRPVGFSRDVFPELLEQALPLYGAITEGYWEDVGTLEAYTRAHRDILDGRVSVDIAGFQVANGMWRGRNVDIHPDARMDGPAIIGDNCRVEAGARLGEYTVLGANVRVQHGVEIERSVIHDNVYVGDNTRLRGTTVGRGTSLHRGVRCGDGSVLGDECYVGDEATIAAGVKVYPRKTIETGATVNSSIVWETKGAHSLFGRTGVSGLANVDITVEVAVRMAMAYATMLEPGSLVVASRDSSRAARMLKRAVMAGLNAGGVDVLDLEQASLPVTRHQVRRPGPKGGITIRIRTDAPDSVVVRFLDANGSDIGEGTQRKIERVLNREDFRMVVPAEIGDIRFAPRSAEHYAAMLQSHIDVEAIAESGRRVVLDYSYGSVSLVMPTVLAKLGTEILTLNPFASTSGAMRAERSAQAQEVAALVAASGASLGAVIGADGERLTLVDEEARVLTDHQATLAFMVLLGPTLGDRDVVLPVMAPGAADLVAGRFGVHLRRSKMSIRALHEAAQRPDVGFVANLDGGFILPSLLASFDATAGLLKMLELLSVHDVRLCDVVDDLPPTHVMAKNVPTAWERKGAVMRALVAEAAPPLGLVDGVRSGSGDRWTLAVPDPELPLTRVWAEAPTESEARRSVRSYASRVRDLAR